MSVSNVVLPEEETPFSEEKKKDFTESFGDERTSWSNEVRDISRRFRDVDNLAEVQVDLYSKRQEAVEYLYKLMGIFTKLKKIHTVEYKKAYDEAGRNEDIRFSEKEKTRAAETVTVNIKFKMDSVTNHIDFFRETIKTIDNMIFGVKHRIEVENFKSGMK
jgi:hypothetical protein